MVGFEAELEFQYADAHALGRQEMAELVDEYEHAKDEDEPRECK